ncbi:LAME_0F01068g1_1 [Lachancea meyersii CBS 8951]|uniref:Mannosyl-oligosaccharide glucosidase n=1 Tax=Lachancea meyersii CBS 8951 TaxID=1266667 RepID=A0A1G4JPP2_9SACH|nr:LAME_0F01068g1_1 [Lachancea meyersii CBS 8951]
MLLQIASILLSICATVFADNAVLNSAETEDYERNMNQSLLWAPYRSNCYFGIRPRFVNENPMMMGLMWFDSSSAEGVSQLRHFVDTGDKLDKYGYELYDPRLGGREVIIDSANNLNLTIHFAKSRNGENWGFRVSGRPLDSSKSKVPSLVMYFSQNGEKGHLNQDLTKRQDNHHTNLKGFSPELGNYDIHIGDISGNYYSRGPALAQDADSSKTSHISFTVPGDQVWKARDIFQSMLGESVQQLLSSGNKMHPLSLPSALIVRNINNFPSGNFHFIQKTFDLDQPFEFDVIYNKKGSQQRIKSSDELSTLISWTVSELEVRFNNKFDIEDLKLKVFAQETLANLMGGIGYFYGTQMVDRETELDEEHFEKIELNRAGEEGPLQLFSSVPSRAFFPRGFYWDEGFHLLQMMEYDCDLVLEILQSWFDLIEEETGWVARELILGNEARSKVPQEFQIQNPNIANPPTLLLCFSELLTRASDLQQSAYGSTEEFSTVAGSQTDELLRRPELLTSFAKKVYPNLLKHYTWWTDSQRGFTEEYMEILGDSLHPEEAFRWVGRTFTHCLPSGLDDYPRSQPPDVAELHLDALAWAGVMTRSMKQIAKVLDMSEEYEKFAQIEQNIVENLDTIHWSEEDHCYYDVTIDDDSDEMREFVRHEGYVSLMPFALKLEPKNSNKLQWFVELMADEGRLFGDYGILSLSRKDEYFETGEVYWRGPVWINMNYLFLDSLAYYFEDGGDAQDTKTVEKARQLYHDLRKNLISNMHRVWAEDGYVYENYNHNTGKGSGVQHFTGWSALIVNILGRLPESL